MAASKRGCQGPVPAYSQRKKKKKNTNLLYTYADILNFNSNHFHPLFVQLLLDVLHVGARRIKYMPSIFLFITFFSLKLYLYKFYTVCNLIISVENKSKLLVNMGISMKVLKNYGRSNKKKINEENPNKVQRIFLKMQTDFSL